MVYYGTGENLMFYIKSYSLLAITLVLAACGSGGGSSDDGDVKDLVFNDPELQRCVDTHRKFAGDIYKNIDTFDSLNCGGEWSDDKQQYFDSGTTSFHGEEIALFRINDLSGIDQLENLKFLFLDSSKNLSINKSVLPQLEHLEMNFSTITSLDLPSGMRQLSFEFSNILSVVDPNSYFLQFQNLEVLNLSRTGLSSLDLSGLTKLTWLDIEDTSISSIDLSDQTNIETLYINGTNIVGLNLVGYSRLKKVEGECDNFNAATVNYLQSLDGEPTYDAKFPSDIIDITLYGTC